jgi:hypothetical protein
VKLEQSPILILDVQSSHILSLTARKCRVVMLLLHSHSTHRMQSLYVTIFKPLSTYIHGFNDSNEAEKKSGQRLLTEHKRHW